MGTPILGFANSSTAYNAAGCFTGTECAGFGEHIKNLGFNCQKLDGCIGWQNLYAQEESGADTFIINDYTFVGADVHFNAQNFGPILNAEILSGSGTTNCAEGTTGIYIGDKSTRGLDGWTINVPSNNTDTARPPACANTLGSVVPIAAVMLDASNTEVRNGHCEGFVNCVLMGANNDPSGGFGGSGEHVDGIEAGPAGAGTNAVQISGNYPANKSFQIQRIRKHGDPHAIVDNILGNTINDGYVGSYAWDTNGSALNLITTNEVIRNRFDSGVQTATVESGVATNTDLAGQCGVPPGVLPSCASISFVHTYTSPPVCTCTDTTATNACSVTVSATSLTVNGSAGHTIDYICIGRN